MPKYKDEYVVGACERLGHPCICPELFVEIAKDFDAFAVKKEISADEYGGFSGLVLDIPEKNIQRAIHALRPNFPGETDDELKFWLDELPCQAFCDIFICAQCGRQHDDSYIFGDSCVIAMEQDIEEDY